MTTLRITHVRHRHRRPGPYVDLMGFFLFFGVSGVDHGRESRLQRRFEAETFTHHVTVNVAPALAPGRYTFEGVPASVARRPWVVEQPGVAATRLSDEGWEAFQSWRAAGPRDVRAIPA